MLRPNRPKKPPIGENPIETNEFLFWQSSETLKEINDNRFLLLFFFFLLLAHLKEERKENILSLLLKKKLNTYKKDNKTYAYYG